MVKKETVGKTQLIIGIILLLGGIIGVILTYNWINKELTGSFSEIEYQLNSLEEGANYSSYSEGSKVILQQGMISLYLNRLSFNIIIAMNLGLLFVLSIILSLLFITQSLVNMKQTNKRKWL